MKPKALADVMVPDIDFGTAPLPDFYDYIDQWRQAGERVVPVNYNGDIAWVILRYEDVQAAYRDDDNLPAAAAYQRHSEPAQGKTLLAMSGEEHRINRLLVAKAFHPQAIEALTPKLLIPLANELVDELADCRDFDLVEGFTLRYPFKVISRMLGIPVVDEQQLHAWLQGLFLYPWDPDAALASKAAITDYLAPIVAARRRQPEDDVISTLVQTEAEGRRLDDEAIYSFIRLLYPAGSDTTYLALGSLMAEVLKRPSLPERLCQHPEERAAVVEEALRFHGTVCLQPRYTERAVEIGGVQIPAHSWLLYGNGPANHDPAVYPDPEDFDATRCPRKLMTFGAGPHFCLGSHLARTELRVALALLLDRMPSLRLADAEKVTISSAVLRGPRALAVHCDSCLPAPPVTETLARL